MEYINLYSLYNNVCKYIIFVYKYIYFIYQNIKSRFYRDLNSDRRIQSPEC